MVLVMYLLIQWCVKYYNAAYKLDQNQQNITCVLVSTKGQNQEDRMGLPKT
jgi:hypothetical protein